MPQPHPTSHLPTRWVLLHHTHHPHLSPHFDWLLENPDAPGGPLLAFRTHIRPDRCPPEGFAATRLRDHRRLYLDFEGEISNNRGHITRLASGTCTLTVGDTRLHVTFSGDPAEVTLRGHRRAGAEWDFQCADTPPDRT